MAQIFARARRGDRSDPVEPTIAALAARIRQPAELRTALETWRGVQHEHVALQAELRAAIAELRERGGDGAPGSAPLIKRVDDLDQQLRGLGDQIRQALDAVIAARPPFIAAVAAALEPHRKSAAQRALVATAALASELDLLGDYDDQLVSVGGCPGSHPLPHHRGALAPMIARLRSIAAPKG